GQYRAPTPTGTIVGMHKATHPVHADWRPTPAMPQQPERYRTVVDQAVELTRRRTEEPIRIAAIARAIGISERTLVRAFRAIHDATPYRYLASLRLLDARQVLSSRSGETVTEVAMRFGFGELGRFSAAYRSAFGEFPSDTLRLATEPTQELPSSPSARSGS